MFTLLFWNLLGIVLLLFLNSSDGACTLPGALRGAWISSVFGDTEFTESIMYLPEYNIITDSISVTNSTNFTCDFSSGNFYVMKTTSMYISNSFGDYYWYICLELTEVTAYSYYFYDAKANDAGRSAYTAYTDVCNVKQATELFHVFVKKGFETEALSYCAKPFLGVFTYIHTSSSANCGLNWGESSLDVCNNNRTSLIFDYNQCSTKVAFSDGGHVGCVAALSNGTTYYQSVINFDTTLSASPKSYRFTCFVIEFDGANVTASEKGEKCVQGQSASIKPTAPGSLLYLVANTTCYIETPTSPEDPSDNTAAIIAGVVVSLVVIATVIGAIFGNRYYKKKKDEKLSEKSKIENLISVGMGNSLAKIPKPLDKQSNGKITSDINENKIKENKVPNEPTTVSIADTLQVVEIDSGSEKERQLDYEKKETKENDILPNDTDDRSELGKNDGCIGVKSNQINGIINASSLASEVIIEEEAVEEVVDETENTEPEKKVTFPEDVQTPRGPENPEHASLKPDMINTATSETETSNVESRLPPSEVLTTFGTENTGPERITISTDGHAANKNDQQLQSNPRTDSQKLEIPFSTYEYKAVELTTGNGIKSPGISLKSSYTGVNSLTPVAEDKPRTEALTNLSGLMSIVSSNPYKRFPQKSNRNNGLPTEEISFKLVRPAVHTFVEASPK